jgi:Cu-Zn family superoxide dismutase
MTTINKRFAGALVVAGLVTIPAGAALAGSIWSTGPDNTYGAANPFADAEARVHVVTDGSGGSTISLQVKGVDADPGRTFGAHVHRATCGDDPLASGGHYQHAGVTGGLEEREVWLDVTVNGSGNGASVTHRSWAIDQSTLRSVVIHALPTSEVDGTAGARLACIDLDGAR